MEKRHKTTVARTLSLNMVCAKLILIGVLFVPLLAAVKYLPQRENRVEPLVLVPVAEKPRPRELTRIYSIVRSHRPDIAEREAWEISERHMGRKFRARPRPHARFSSDRRGK